MKSFGVEIPFVSHLGFTLHRMEGGESELRYEAKPEHLNSFAVTHGGASMTLLDEAAIAFAQALRGPEAAQGRAPFAAREAPPWNVKR